jgi:hypothetical protein
MEDAAMFIVVNTISAAEPGSHGNGREPSERPRRNLRQFEVS